MWKRKKTEGLALGFVTILIIAATASAGEQAIEDEGTIRHKDLLPLDGDSDRGSGPEPTSDLQLLTDDPGDPEVGTLLHLETGVVYSWNGTDLVPTDLERSFTMYTSACNGSHLTSPDGCNHEPESCGTGDEEHHKP